MVTSSSKLRQFRLLSLSRVLVFGSLVFLTGLGGCVVFVPLLDTNQPDPEEARVHAARERYYRGTPSSVRVSRAPSSEARLNKYIRQLNDKSGAKRTEAASFLGMMGETAAPAVPALVSALRDPERFVRRASARALGKIGRPALSAKSALEEAANDRDSYVAHTARLALKKLSRLS